MHLFIDTNIFLNFYHFSRDDLVQLKKLSQVLEETSINLLLPSQVEDEFWRNRESKLADALKKFRDTKFEDSFPRVCQEYAEYQSMRETMRSFLESKKLLEEKLVADIESSRLQADSLIRELFSKSTKILLTKEIYNKAEMRVNLGSPPGKKGSFGDAVNWESILSFTPNGAELYFVSADSDYWSPLSDALKRPVFNEYLRSEWRVSKTSEIFSYEKLSDFFVEKFPDIKLKTENASSRAVDDLVASGSFAWTHQAVKSLSKVEKFGRSDIQRVASALVNNDQISSIIGDDDVFSFANRFLKEYGEHIESATRDELYLLLSEAELSRTKWKNESDLQF